LSETGWASNTDAPKVAVGDRHEVEGQLHEPRPVEPQLGAQVGGFLRTGVLAQTKNHRIARDGMHETGS